MPAVRFWGDFDPLLAQSLSAEQRAEIERVLALNVSSRPNSVGDFRLSFRWFFVRVLWGREKRSVSRLKQESKLYPAIRTKNAPVLLTMGIAYTAFWYMVVGVSAYLFTDYIVH